METFQYKGYSIELSWSSAGERVEATAKVISSPAAAKKMRCNCSIKGFVMTTSVGVFLDLDKLSKADQKIKAKSFAIKALKRLHQEIDDHRKEGCLTPSR